MKISIIDELNSQTHSAIEVKIILSDDSRRWCYFVNSDSMHNFGDCINKTNIRLHYGSPHMIVVAGEITKNIIEQVLHQLEENKEIINCTLPINDFAQQADPPEPLTRTGDL